MRQSEARDLRSFLKEPVEEIVVEGVKARSIDLQQDQLENAQVGARFTSPLSGTSPSLGTSPWAQDTVWDRLQDTGAPLQETGVKFISGTNAQLQGTGVRFTTPWEGTGGQLHEVGARFTSPLLGTSLLGTNPLESNPLGSNPLGSNPLGSFLSRSNPRTTDDFTLQQTMPIARIPDMDNVGARFTSPSGTFPWGTPQESTPQTLKPYRLQRYQSRGVPVSLSRSASGTLRLRPAGSKEQRATADLAPAPQKIVPGAPSPTLQSWERRRHAIYTWLVLLLLFLLVVLGGIGLDSLIASYR